MARRNSTSRGPAWRRVLAAVEEREDRDRWASTHALRYDFAPGHARFSGNSIVRVHQVMGTGEHASFVRATLSPSLPDLVAPEDVPLLALLQGCSRTRAAADRYGRVEATFDVPPPLVSEVLRRLVETGRAYLAKADGEPDPRAPAIAWDPRGYRLALEVDTEPTYATALAIVPVLLREEERVPVTEPAFFAPGLVLFQGRLAELDEGGQREWIGAFRMGGPATIAEVELPALLAEIHARQESPEVRLAPDRAYARVQVVPRPYAILRTPAARGISIELGLDYDGLRVHPHEPGHALVDRARRRIVDRDDPRELAALEEIEELGGEHVGGRFRIPKRDLLVAIRTLLAAGWRVEVDGKLYRRATSFSMGVTSGIDWLDVTVDARFDGAPATLAELITAMRHGKQMVVLSDGSVADIPEEWLERLRRWSALAEPTSSTLRFKKSQAGLVAALAEGESAIAVDASFEQARRELRAFDGIPPRDPPASFRGTLREYQRQALGWFAFLERFGFGGCLADDMGLGKTVQVLALLEARRAAGGGPSLVVAPRSLLFNWAAEAARFAPELRVHVHDGAGRDTGGETLAAHDVVMTTYGLLRRDAEGLAKVPFEYVVLDEAQAIKTARSAAAKAARRIQAKHRLALTGTPIENHLGELASLLDFLNPGVLGTSGALARLEPGARRLDEETRVLLGRAVRPFFLRRTKGEVAKELPARVEQTIYCELEPEHRRIYDELREHYRRAITRRIAKDGWGKSAVHVLEALLRLRQVACHPGLVDKTRRAESSAKLDALFGQLESARAEGHKALVFSQFTTLLGLVKARLDQAKVSYEYLDGATKDRAERVARFQSDADCSVFLLSLKAGGVGLNLPAADYVFLLDPWWNPATEAQAIDRAHRIGQTRTVFAYRLLARGTIEEKVEKLQKEKRSLADSFFAPSEGGASLKGLTREDLEALLG
ncbi:MAG TPA: SNF2-related protein [Polyangiaceae bacterium]|jgi:superfamily II DNA or RNA helicase